MRIAMIGPYLDRMGGIASLAQTFMNSKALSDIEIHYFGTVGNGSIFRRVAQMGRGQARFLGALACGWRPDLYHIFVSDGLSFYRKMLYFEQARITGRPIVLHNNFAHLDRLYISSPIHAAAIRYLYSKADQVQVISNDMANKIDAWTQGRANIRVLFNPVSVKEFGYPGPRDWREQPIVLFMGYVGDRKGTFDLVAAIPRVLKRVPTVRFRFGGNGELERLRKEVKRLGIAANVEVMGWIEGKARLAAFAEADLYCLPSYAEGLPVSILEAMASGLAIVSTNVNGIPDAIVEGITGFMVEPGDRQALADCLIRLLEDIELRDDMGAAGRKRVKEVFDSEIIAATLKKYWKEVLM